MNHKSVLFALILFLVSASAVAAGAPASPARPTSPTPALAPAPVPSQGGCFAAGLNGNNEVPPTGSSATGIAAFVLAPADPLTTTRKLIYYTAFTTNTLGTQTLAHIHKGAPGVIGPIVAPLSVGNPVSGTVSLTSTADLLAGQLYVNIHTTAKPDGEIRGQILPSGGCFSATLSGAQETPSNGSPGTGTGFFLLVPPDPLTTTQKLVYNVEFTGTVGTENNQHIHRGARGVMGPVVIPLPPGKQKNGVLLLDAGLVADLLAGRLYVNIHTNIVVAGEIRGQIEPLGGRCYAATLSGAQETPPNKSAATGYGFFTLLPSTVTTTTLKLTYQISFTNTLSETAAHFHKAPPGIGGPIVIPLPNGNPKTGVLTLTSAHAADLISGLYYVNIHSPTFLQGEIRGQVVQIQCSTATLPIVTRPSASE